MNEAPRTLRARHRIGVAATLALIALASACSNPLTKIHEAQGPPRCADLVAHAFASPNVPVSGAYACFSAPIQAEATQLTPPVTDDASLAAYSATDPVLTSYKYIGSKFDATSQKLYYYFEFQPGPLCWRVHLDASGKVADGQWKQGPCLPLP